jgi:hypothetical protein
MSRTNGFDVQFGLEYRWNDRISLLFGAILDSPVTRDLLIDQIDDEILTIGRRVRLGRRRAVAAFFALEEDAIANAGPDVTFPARLERGSVTAAKPVVPEQRRIRRDLRAIASAISAWPAAFGCSPSTASSAGTRPLAAHAGRTSSVSKPAALPAAIARSCSSR